VRLRRPRRLPRRPKHSGWFPARHEEPQPAPITIFGIPAIGSLWYSTWSGPSEVYEVVRVLLNPHGLIPWAAELLGPGGSVAMITPDNLKHWIPTDD
jgi:hypothetical protein